ncbi:PAS domain S-box protein [Shigella flexneri]
MILDSRGNIQRFNRLCEDYTGLKEHDVIGQSVFKLFMSRREAAASRSNNRVFFRAAMHMKSNCGYQHVKARLFSVSQEICPQRQRQKRDFFICSAGTHITRERRAQERLRILANTSVSPDCRIVTQCRS